MHRVGRHPDAELCLGEQGARVSRFHAVLAWQGDAWVARDLGSRNGTVCGSVALVPGQDHTLTAGDTLAFGGPDEAWTLLDASPPAAWAFDGERRIGARDGVLAFPDDVHILRLDPRAGWVFVFEDGERPVVDGTVVTVSGLAWTLHLPSGPAPTVAAAQGPTDVTVVLRVVSDKVEVRVQRGADVVVLRPRAHLQVLLVLARERSRARRRAQPEEEAGWVTISDMATHLGITSNVAYVWWYRLREQLEAEGVDAGLVERRFTGELRLADVPVTIEEEGQR